MSTELEAEARAALAVSRPQAARRVHVARGTGLLVCVALLLLGVLVSLAVGAKNIPLGTVWTLLWSPDGSFDSSVIHDLRIPRTALAVVVGAAIAVAGALMQVLTRNPLADPGILGVTAGADTAVVFAVSVLGITTWNGYVWFAFAGAAFGAAVVYLLGFSGRAAATPVRLAVAGIAVTYVLGGLAAVMIFTDPDTYDAVRAWRVGSIAGRDADVVLKMLPFAVAGLLLALALAAALNTIALGEDLGRALGAHVNRTRLLGGLAVVLLAGTATAAAGPIVFLGLMVPHMARAITGPDHRWLLPYTVVLGALLILVSDVVGRVVVRPGELEVGFVTAVIGAPVFIAVVRRRGLVKL